MSIVYYTPIHFLHPYRHQFNIRVRLLLKCDIEYPATKRQRLQLLLLDENVRNFILIFNYMLTIYSNCYISYFHYRDIKFRDLYTGMTLEDLTKLFLRVKSTHFLI